MKRPLSQLVYARIQEGDGTPRIITLHKHNQFGPGVKAAASAAAPNARIIGLESAKGIYVGRTIVGYTWFVGPLHQPAPIFFGDALAEIERFLWDEIDRQEGERAELPFLLGVEQGAIMAIAAAAAVPDLLSGVMAVDSSLPIVPGWSPPLAPLDGLPMLLVDRPDALERDGVLTGEELARTLERWGGVVTRVVTDEEGDTAALANWLREREPRFRTVGSEQGPES